jgi:hypothetical protein
MRSAGVASAERGGMCSANPIPVGRFLHATTVREVRYQDSRVAISGFISMASIARFCAHSMAP